MRLPLLLSVLVGYGCCTTTPLCLGGRSMVEHPSPTKTERSSGRAPLLLSVLVGDGCCTTTSLCLGGRWMVDHYFSLSWWRDVVVQHLSPTKTERSSGRASPLLLSVLVERWMWYHYFSLSWWEMDVVPLHLSVLVGDGW